MTRYAIVGGGPKEYIPNLSTYKNEDIIWIGADQGAEVIVEYGLPLSAAIGDFDSVSASSMETIKKEAHELMVYPNEKNETDLELAILYAQEQEARHILFFGVTGGRMDHTLINIQTLYPLWNSGIRAQIHDLQNQMELFGQGSHTIGRNEDYPYLSFVPITLDIWNLNLYGFYYPLEDAHLPYGSTLCISNHLIEEEGTFSFSQGILLVIRSKDII
ncbi:thiamine pyrophosphokinase [Halobacillus andaensis]|uniref:Thiamine diphosphokinase n=1 Tax=Halobacillus andaensis TaxID=1176239 RepID=A0A917AZM7_HALAA|nr:thiamine diphosphokinase [Halobacillus andaensis]MBP2003538.1 thiamine pyrophosphokinase [Halobacillus andaensis]GGF11408.1 thiamine pyrophosphokinase [Halobacillus andaensis]